jgi:glutaredoxin 3
MTQVVMYTTGMCPYCVRAKMLLQNKGVAWEEVRIEGDRALMREMMERSGRRTVPQIFIGDRHVGGFDDLAELDAFGQLDPLLGLAPHLDEAATPHAADASEDGPT